MTMNPNGAILFQGVSLSDPAQTIDFEATARAGYGAAAFRATRGNEAPPASLAQRVDAARAAGMHTGCWHELTARNVPQARTQARRFMSAIRGLPLTLRPALRFERFTGLDIRAVNDIALAFLETVRFAGGILPVIYTDAQSADLMWTTALAHTYGLWVIAPGEGAPEVSTAMWDTWTAWQYDNAASVPGLSGPAPVSRMTEGMLAASEDEDAPEDEGAVPGFTPPSAAPTAPTAPDTKLICVTANYGDTLSAIARLFDTTADAIARMNGMADPDILYPGARLYLRVRASSPIPACESYTVRQGDSLWAIARRLGLDLDRLIRDNAIADPALIRPGQVLKI